MKTKICSFLFVLFLLTACGADVNAPIGASATTPTPTGTPTMTLANTPTVPPTATPTLPPTIMATPSPTATVPPTATQPVTIAGGDFLAIAVDDLGDGWMRIRTAGNRDNCSWSNQFRFTMTGTIQAQVPHCWEMRMTGTGTATFEVKPDEIGYDTSDTLGTGLAFWPSGNNGQYRVSHDNGTTWTDLITLTTGPEGVNFPKNGSAVLIEFKLENGYMAMPLGEIRNNVQPKY